MDNPGFIKSQLAKSIRAGDGGAGMQVPPIERGGTPESAQPIPELLTPAQTAQILGVTECDVLASLDAGELKGQKIGSAWRITKTDLDAFLAE